jgi:hypothetical protein
MNQPIPDASRPRGLSYAIATAAAITALLAASSARAEDIEWHASAAESDDYSTYPGGYAFLRTRPRDYRDEPAYVFVEDSGTFTEEENDPGDPNDGTAHLTGTICHYDEDLDAIDQNDCYAVDVWFTATQPDDGYEGQQDLTDDAYAEDGGPVDPDTWRYYHVDEDRSTLVGTGRNSGQRVRVYERPSDGSEPFQVGMGANNLNAGMGASGGIRTRNGFVAINIDLTHAPELSAGLPARNALVLAAGGLLIAAGRRRRRTHDAT